MCQMLLASLSVVLLVGALIPLPGGKAEPRKAANQSNGLKIYPKAIAPLSRK
jgi:hypothetical protein